jgi:1-acyl-sn-glycerol-3-phosphate acyltransferase
LVLGIEKISFVFIALLQLFVGLLTLIWLRISTRLEIDGLENLREVKEPMIVVANHESHLDPMLVGAALIHQPGLFPLRYLAKNELFNYPVFGLVIFLLGAFRAHKKKGLEKSLLTPLRTLKAKGAVVIFPEGHIVPERPKIGPGRRGTAILAAVSGAGILPISLHTPANLSAWKMTFTRPKITINIGQQFYLQDPEHFDFSDDQMAKPTKLIMDKISELYYQK